MIYSDMRGSTALTNSFIVNPGLSFFVCLYFTFFMIVSGYMFYVMLMFTGKILVNLNSQTAVRTCGWSYSGRMCMYTSDQTMGLPCEIHIFDASDPSQMSKFT